MTTVFWIFFIITLPFLAIGLFMLFAFVSENISEKNRKNKIAKLSQKYPQIKSRLEERVGYIALDHFIQAIKYFKEGCDFEVIETSETTWLGNVYDAQGNDASREITSYSTEIIKGKKLPIIN